MYIRTQRALAVRVSESVKNVISSETRKYDFTIIICDYKLKKGITIMDKINFLFDDTVVLATVSKISENVIKFTCSETLPEESVLLSGFNILNEHNNKNMSGNYYHDYNTIYKNIDDKIVLLSNNGSVYDDSSTPSVSENTTVELTEEEKIELERQNKIYSIQSEINDLKSQLAETDYIVIKCQEYELAGKDLPDEYDIVKFSEERDSIREQINVLEKELSEL